jgi:hypothetical protein
LANGPAVQVLGQVRQIRTGSAVRRTLPAAAKRRPRELLRSIENAIEVVLLVAAVVLVTTDLLIASAVVRTFVDALHGEGNPVIVWPAIALLLGVLAILLLFTRRLAANVRRSNAASRQAAIATRAALASRGSRKPSPS